MYVFNIYDFDFNKYLTDESVFSISFIRKDFERNGEALLMKMQNYLIECIMHSIHDSMDFLYPNR